MKKIIFAVLTITVFGLAQALAASAKENRLTCAHTTFPMTIIVDLATGVTKLVDNEAGGFLAVETFTVKRDKTNVELTQSAHNDLPPTVFKATIEVNGVITATSFDDMAGAKSQYKCVLTQ